MHKITTSTRGLVLALLAALAVASLAGASDARAARGMEVAIQDDAVFLNQQYYNRETALAQARAMGVTRIRVNVLWTRALASGAGSRKRPRHVAYVWWPYDSLIDTAAGYGIRIQMTLGGPAPAWATGNHRRGIYKPNPRLYGQFARAAARHFKGRVDRYSVWNEPNYRGWLAPKRTAPQRYRAMYVRAYRAIKGADRRAKVLIGETSPTGHPRNAIAPLSFLRALTRRGRLRADGFAHHPYAYTVPPGRRFGGPNDVTMGTLGRLSGTLRKLRRSRKLRTPRGGTVPIYLTEFGYHARGRFGISERRRASWTLGAFRIAQRNGSVREMLHYLLVEPAANGFWHSRLIRRSGRLERPYRVLRNWARHARIKRAPRRVSLPPMRP